MKLHQTSLAILDKRVLFGPVGTSHSKVQDPFKATWTACDSLAILPKENIEFYLIYIGIDFDDVKTNPVISRAPWSFAAILKVNKHLNNQSWCRKLNPENHNLSNHAWWIPAVKKKYSCWQFKTNIFSFLVPWNISTHLSFYAISSSHLDLFFA